MADPVPTRTGSVSSSSTAEHAGDSTVAKAQTHEATTTQEPDLEKVVSEKPSIHHPSQFPDGGTQAWLAVAGGFACLFVSFGWINGKALFLQLKVSGTNRIQQLVSSRLIMKLFFSPHIPHQLLHGSSV